MKIHEFQAKGIFRDYDISVPEGNVAETSDEAAEITEKLGGKVVVKAQIHAGGRGKGGGVKLAEDPDEVREFAGDILGNPLVTPQTGDEGQIVKKILVEEGVEIENEFYAGIILDREKEKPVLMTSEAGGMNIEEVAEEKPELIHNEIIDPRFGIQPYQLRRIGFNLGMDFKQVRKSAKIFDALFQVYEDKDVSLIEINPLVETAAGDIIAIDAKINFDDNALYRHPEIVELRDTDEEDPIEVEASEYDLSYIKLDGNVGCMVNGAGLAMSTMDIIKLAGASPANFLDVGGGADENQIENAFKILMSDDDVEAVLINIFGGILRCDILAEGVLKAASNIDIDVPMVVRMEGTNVERGRQILKESSLNFTVAEGMKEAADKTVELAG